MTSCTAITHYCADILLLLAVRCWLQSPFHLMVGGGDQVYCDAVWQSPALMAWCSIRDPVTRLQHPFTQDMVNQVFHYFFTRYSSHWSEPEFGTALSCIPQIMTWDDHDVSGASLDLVYRWISHRCYYVNQLVMSMSMIKPQMLQP